MLNIRKNKFDKGYTEKKKKKYQRINKCRLSNE